jgi:hypothetical protein
MDALSTAVRMWCLHELMKLLHVSATLWTIISAVIVATAALRPAHTVTIAALTVRLVDTVMLIPMCWDSFYWCLQTDAALLTLLLMEGARQTDARRAALATWWADLVRQQLSIFYVAAGFWKCNTSFLDPRTSCAPIFVLTLAKFLGVPPPGSLAPLVARAAPAAVVTGEMAIGVLLLSSRPRLARLGVGLALCLHLGILLTPPPNNATPFSVACVVRLLITQPFCLSAALNELATTRVLLDSNPNRALLDSNTDSAQLNTRPPLWGVKL